MLKELHISNYRLFDELNIPDLGQVNLIAGKNNTGKTALLEALRIWAAKGENTVINHVINSRGDLIPDWQESYKSIFNNFEVFPGQERWVSINELVIYPTQQVGKDIEYKVKNNNNNRLLNAGVSPNFPKDKAIFVPFTYGNFPLQYLWDKIVLTPSEDDVLDIIRIVEPRIRRLDVKENSSKLRLDGMQQPIQLRNLGDGINRLLWIAVALVSAKNSMLLIDEFEAGLHHSVQEMLWEKIFFYAQKWDIQVFVTTHSMDTVRTFYSVADRDENKGKGRFFRLQRSSKGQIEAVGYGEEELATALEFDLETR